MVLPERGAEERLGAAGLAVFGLALALRLLHLFLLRDAPFFSMLMGDAEGYALWARELAAGDWLGDRVFYQAPLYPYFLGGIQTLFGDSPTAVKLVQCALGAAGCWLLAGAGLRFFSKRVGLAAGVALAIYPPAIFFDGLVQKSALDAFLVSGLLLLVGELRLRESLGRWVALGAVSGALILTRENALVLLPPLAVLALLATQRRSAAMGLLVGVTLLLGPVALRNFVVGGEWHLTTSQLGTNLYIGNGAGATGTYKPLRYGRGSFRHEREDATTLAEAAVGRALTPAEVSRYWTSRTFGEVSADPGAWVSVVGRKLLLVSNAAELVDTEDFYTHAEWSWPLRALGSVWHFGTLAPLAVVGIVVAWPRRRELWPIPVLALCYAGSVVLFYVVARYRHPLVPMLILLAAAGLVGLPGWWRAASAGLRGALVAAVAASALFCNWPVESEARMRSATHRNVAVMLKREGQREASMREFERALELDPDNVLALHGLGAGFHQRGDLENAMRLYRAALARKADHAPSHAKLGTALAQRGDHERAIAHYREALASDPTLPLAYFQLGISLAVLGQVDEAEPAFREALRLDVESRRRLARMVLGTLDRPSVGLSERVTSLRLARVAAEAPGPPDSLVSEALAAALFANGRTAAAAREVQRATRLAAEDPARTEEDREALRSRAAAYTRGGGD